MPDSDIPEITKTEVRAMLLAADMAEIAADDAKLAAYYDYVLGAVDTATLAMEPVMWEQVRSQLTHLRGSEEIAAARATIARQADTLARGLVESEIKKVNSVIDAAIGEGKRGPEIAKRLDMVKGLDSNRSATFAKYRRYLENIDPPLSPKVLLQREEKEFQRLLNARRHDIAQTEMRFSTSEANRNTAEARGQNYKAWMTRGTARVCAICAGNEAASWIPIKKNFPSGHAQTPGHPGGCGCTLAYRTAAPNEFARKRAKDRAEATAAAREEAEDG